MAIARALLFRPEVLLCDEPTGHLDDFTGQQIIDLFGELNRDGLTLILVTHEPRVALATTRLLHMQNGRIHRGGNGGLDGTSPAEEPSR